MKSALGAFARGALALICALSVSGNAHAQSSAQSNALFQQGRTLLANGHIEEACDRFSRSVALEPSVGGLLNLGGCSEQLGRFASAWGAYREGIALAIKLGSPRVKDHMEGAARVEPRLSHLTLAIDAQTTAGLVVLRNTATVMPASYDVALPVDAGPQVIEASAPDFQPWKTTITLREAETKTVHIPALQMLERKPAAVAATAATPALLHPDEVPSSRGNTLALGLEIGGAATLGVGLIFGAFTIAKWSSVTNVCPDGHCPTEADRLRMNGDAITAKTFATVSTIAISVGAVALASGIVLHLTTPHASVAIAGAIDRDGGGVAIAFTR